MKYVKHTRKKLNRMSTGLFFIVQLVHFLKLKWNRYKQVKCLYKPLQY